LSGVGVNCGAEAFGWINRCVRRVKIVIGEVAVTGGLEGGDLGLGGGGGSVTANSTRGTERKASENADDGDDSQELDQGERVVGTIFVLVEREESRCSHSDEPNFYWQISKVKKQLVHVGGVAGGDLDHWASGGVGLPGDQRGNQGGQKGGGCRDGGIDQNGGERLLFGVFFLSIEQWYYGFNIFDQHEHDEYEWGKLTGHCFFGGPGEVHQ